jgi:hypothetical protein
MIRVGGGCRREGSTLVVVALLIAAVAMLSLSFLMVLRSSQKENQGSRQSLAALYACEAGLSQAVKQLALGQTGDVGSSYQPQAIGEQTVWVQATDIGDSRIALQSHGFDDGARMDVELVVQPAKTGFFRWAAFGDESLHLDSNARTDSYDSALGSYLDQMVNGAGSNAYANTNGDVGSNADITMDSNNQVWGDANPGPSGTVSGSGVANIYGNTTSLPATIDLPDIIVPVIPSTGSLTVSSSQTLASGSYNYGTLQVNVGKTLTVVGPATIVCSDFKLKSNSSLIVDATNGPVEFYVVNDFVLNSNTSIYSTDYLPKDVTFNLLSDNILDPGIDVLFDEDLVDFDSGSKMYGTIYAPSAEVTIDSNFELFGSLVARRVDLDSNCRIHYDETLATLSDEAGNQYERISWRLLSQP